MCRQFWPRASMYLMIVSLETLPFGLFFSGKEIKHRRRHFQKRRQQLQKAKKYRAIKKLEQKEKRWMRAINHNVSRRIVDFADWLNADLVLENLSGCRQTMKQSKKSRSDNGESRHAWAYYDLHITGFYITIVSRHEASSL